VGSKDIMVDLPFGGCQYNGLEIAWVGGWAIFMNEGDLACAPSWGCISMAV